MVTRRRAVAGTTGFVEQGLEQDAADAAAAKIRFDAEGELGQIVIAYRLVQLGDAMHLVVLDIGDGDRLWAEAARDVVVDEAIVDCAVEAIAPALRIETQQMIAQQRQLVVPQNADGTGRDFLPDHRCALGH